jgi:hypothetical protein
MIASVFYRNRFLGKTFWFTAQGIGIAIASLATTDAFMMAITAKQ